MKKPDMVHEPIIPVLRRQRQKELRGELASQGSLLDEAPILIRDSVWIK